MGVATRTVLRVVLSVALEWGGGCNTDRVMCSPVCGVCNTDRVTCSTVGGGEVGGGFVTSCRWGWGGLGFSTKTVLRAVLSVGWCLQHRPCYVWSCLGGVGFAT